MALENRAQVFIPKKDLADRKLVEAFEQLGYEVRERPQHPLVQVLQRILPFKDFT